MHAIMTDKKNSSALTPRAAKPARRAVVPQTSDGAGARAQAVYRALRRAIIEQALRAGAKLPEDAIGARFGVSRTLVHEALTRLAVEGLVSLRPNRGATVAQPTLEEAHQAFEVRRGLERLVMEHLAGNLPPDGLQALQDHIAREDAARDHGGPESIRLAGEFHVLLAQMTGNALLERYIGEVSSRCSLILAAYGRAHSPECAVSEHRQIVAALQNGDAVRAIATMDAHLRAIAHRAVIVAPATADIQQVLAPYAEREQLQPARA